MYGRPIADSAMRSGKVLAANYCQGCHQLPDPALLNKGSWQKGVLPAMGPRLGIFVHAGVRYPSYASDPYVGRSFYPSKPLLTDWQWQNIIDYYAGAAPDSLPPQPEHAAINMDLSLFRAIPVGIGHGRPFTCYVHADTAGGRREVVAGQVFPGALLWYDSLMRQVDSTPVYGGIVDMQFTGDTAVACNIGDLRPNNALLGSLSRLHIGPRGRWVMDGVPFIRDLARPVQVNSADLNGDGRKDYLVCEFGHQKGALSWFEQKADGSYDRHVLRAQPGAIRAYIEDANGDGLPDVWALFAQGDEGIFLFINKGNGRFEEQRVLSFPPMYGSSYFELADMNKDGHPDIIYTCGDNGDYSPVFKPYHGVYVFLNDGSNHFTQRYFYPINGCYKAVARDFDGDGDVDLAAIAYFADYKRHPEEGFVYLENKGDLTFQPFSLPQARSGRWLTMEAGDLNGDGRPDLLLGNFTFGPTISKGLTDWKRGPVFILLLNKGQLK
jgi:hypothetical protein